MTNKTQKTDIKRSSEKPEKSRKKLWILIIAVVVILLCLVAGIGLFAKSANQLVGESAKEAEPIKRVLDNFMQAMLEKDLGRAYELYSTPATEHYPVMTDLLLLIQEDKYVFFEGYQSLDITNLKLAEQANTESNVDAEIRTLAEAKITISYANKPSRQFTATLEKIDGEWYLNYVDFGISPQ